MILCIHHANCADGFGAAWVVRKAFGAEHVRFHAAIHGEPAPDVTGLTVIIVDFSYSLEVLQQMAKVASSVLILDHHKTARDALRSLPSAGNDLYDYATCKILLRDSGRPVLSALFDMERSGAGLAWDFFFPDTPRPALINHIEDRDLWLFRLEGTREIQANVFSYPYDFDAWDQLMEMDVATHRAEGAAIERKHHKDVAELVGVTKRRMVIGGFDVPVANLPYTLTSDAGHLMAKGEPFAACYYDTEAGRIFSLRSNEDGLDVSEIAQQYGGGGHRNAAGFRVGHDHPLAAGTEPIDRLPAGHVVVPIEPTPAMIQAAEEAHMPFGDMDIALRCAAIAGQRAMPQDVCSPAFGKDGAQ